MKLDGDGKMENEQMGIFQKSIREYDATQAGIPAGSHLLQKTSVLSQINNHHEEMEQELRIHLVNKALRAIDVLYEIMVNPSSTDHDKIIAAKDILDRAGFKPVEKIHFVNLP
jgi:hypothetical protein